MSLSSRTDDENIQQREAFEDALSEADSRCANCHVWFNSEDCQSTNGELPCPCCGSLEVESL